MAGLSFGDRLRILTSGSRPTPRAALRSRKQGQNITAAILATGDFTARWTTIDYVSLSREGYGRNPYVYAAIRQIATAFAGIKWKVYTDDTKKKELTSHPLVDLWKRPNPWQGHSAFFENMIAYLLLDGNSFMQMLGPDNRPPLELYTLRPDRMTLIPGTVANPIAGYTYRLNDQKYRLPAETVMHLKMFNPLDDWRGLSPISAAATAIDQSNAAKAWNVSLLQNGARTTGVVTSQGLLDDEQYTRLKEQIAEEYSGFMNAGRPILLEGGATWTEAGMSPQDMSWLEGQKLSSREIAIVYNIAPELLGDSENKTYSNYGEARLALYQENILPASDFVREELNRTLCTKYPDNPYLDYDPADIEALQEDQDAVEKRATSRFNAGYMKVNEARKETGLEEDSGEFGDKYIWQLPQRAPAESAAPELPKPGNKPPELPEGVPPQGQLPAPGAGTPERNGGEPEVSPEGQPAGNTGAGGAGAAKRTVVPFARGRATNRSAVG